jgi:hypothetical protein
MLWNPVFTCGCQYLIILNGVCFRQEFKFESWQTAALFGFENIGCRLTKHLFDFTSSDDGL